MAPVYSDYEAVDEKGISGKDILIAMNESRKNLYNALAAFENISKIQLYPTEYEKTAKKDIKRYLYTNFSQI